MQRLNDAVTEGRLTMAEFDERVAAVLRARTASEVAPHLADLPGPAAGASGAGEQPGTAVAPAYGEIRTTASTVKRESQWLVPQRLSVNSKAGTVKLDFTEAVIRSRVVELALDVYAGTVVLVLPPEASVNVEGLEAGMFASSVKIRKIATSSEPTGHPHIVVSGRQWAGTLLVRQQRRFLHWRW